MAIEPQKLLDEILLKLNDGENEKKRLEKSLRSCKSEHDQQLIELENQFAMIVNLVQETQTQLIEELNGKYKLEKQRVNEQLSSMSHFVENTRKQKNEIDKESVIQISHLHDNTMNEWKANASQKSLNVNHRINVVLNTTELIKLIPKMAYIQMIKDPDHTQKDDHSKTLFVKNENINLMVKPMIEKLTPNSTNTKVCVSWKFLVIDNDELNEIKSNDDDDDEVHALNVNDIHNIDIEWQYDNSENRHYKQKWNVIDVDYTQVLKFGIKTSIFDHFLNTLNKWGTYSFRIRLYSVTKSMVSNVKCIKTFKININHIKDEWNVQLKQKEIKLGFFNKQMATRESCGKYRHVFGNKTVDSGINVWTLRIKKKDQVRKKVTAMIGLVNINLCNNNLKTLKSLNGCFSHIGIGYGILCQNGDLYQTKNGRPYGKEIKQGDIVQIMADYRGQFISFIVNNEQWGTAFNRKHFPNGKMPVLGLAVALKASDKIVLVDFLNKNDGKKTKKSRAKAEKPKKIAKENKEKSYASLGEAEDDPHDLH